jgi:hypothetical protein
MPPRNLLIAMSPPQLESNLCRLERAATAKQALIPGLMRRSVESGIHQGCDHARTGWSKPKHTSKRPHLCWWGR